MIYAEASLVLNSSPALVLFLVPHLRDLLTQGGSGDGEVKKHHAVALPVALQNTLYHESMEPGSDLHQGRAEEFRRMAKANRLQRAICGWRIYASVRLSSKEAFLIILMTVTASLCLNCQAQQTPPMWARAAGAACY